MMDHYMAGLIKYAPITPISWPPTSTATSALPKVSFAPTASHWSVDNRTAAFRLCGDRQQSDSRRMPDTGSDMNPYLAQAAMLAAGIKGIEEKWPASLCRRCL